MSTFALSEEHEALREAVRALADDKIAPRAADIDRTSEFPWDVYEALVKADFPAVGLRDVHGLEVRLDQRLVHVPGELGGTVDVGGPGRDLVVGRGAERLAQRLVLLAQGL